MSRMRVVQVSRPNGALELVERDVPDPAAGEVRIKVQACGICHSDSLTREGTFPGLQYPRVPGHEVIGSIEVSPFVLIAGRRSIKGWYSGTSIDSQETLAFSVRSGVRSMNESSRWRARPRRTSA